MRLVVSRAVAWAAAWAAWTARRAPASPVQRHSWEEKAPSLRCASVPCEAIAWRVASLEAVPEGSRKCATSRCVAAAETRPLGCSGLVPPEEGASTQASRGASPQASEIGD